MVAGADGDLGRIAEALEPEAGGGELFRRREVDHIAGYHHMVGRMVGDVGGDRVQDGLDMPPLLAPPRETAQQPFRGDVAPAKGQGRRRGCQVREMGETEGGHVLS